MEYVEGLGELSLTLNEARNSMKNMSQKVEYPNKIWHIMWSLMEGDKDSMEFYEKKFVLLWEILCSAFLLE